MEKIEPLRQSSLFFAIHKARLELVGKSASGQPDASAVRTRGATCGVLVMEVEPPKHPSEMLSAAQPEGRLGFAAEGDVVV